MLGATRTKFYNESLSSLSDEALLAAFKQQREQNPTTPTTFTPYRKPADYSLLDKYVLEGKTYEELLQMGYDQTELDMLVSEGALKKPKSANKKVGFSEDYDEQYEGELDNNYSDLTTQTLEEEVQEIINMLSGSKTGYTKTELLRAGFSETAIDTAFWSPVVSGGNGQEQNTNSPIYQLQEQFDAQLLELHQQNLDENSNAEKLRALVERAADYYNMSTEQVMTLVDEKGTDWVLTMAEGDGLLADLSQDEIDAIEEDIDLAQRTGQRLDILHDDQKVAEEQLKALENHLGELVRMEEGVSQVYHASNGKEYTISATGSNASSVNWPKYLADQIKKIEDEIAASKAIQVYYEVSDSDYTPKPSYTPNKKTVTGDLKNNVVKNNVETTTTTGLNNPLKRTKQVLQKFDTGGYTGDWHSGEGRLAMLHQKELVLNATDTANFIQLRDILRDMDIGNPNTGITNYEIHIEVDEISDDYSVEQLADKVKDLIVEESNYRNVNQINTTR